MTSVLLLRPGSRALLPLQEGLSAAGCRVLATVDDCSKLVQAAVQHAPDLVVGEVLRPDEALFKATQTLAEVLPRPVLLFTDDPDADHIERATGAGVHAWVVGGYDTEREQALLKQLRDVSQRFEERKLVERAKGILMRARALSDDDAFELLRTASMHTNQRLGQVSEQIIQSAHVAEALNHAGQLRMLSQRVVKFYLLRLADLPSRQQQALLDESVQRVDANLAWPGNGPFRPGSGSATRSTVWSSPPWWPTTASTSSTRCATRPPTGCTPSRPCTRSAPTMPRSAPCSHTKPGWRAAWPPAAQPNTW